MNSSSSISEVSDSDFVSLLVVELSSMLYRLESVMSRCFTNKDRLSLNVNIEYASNI